MSGRRRWARPQGLVFSDNAGTIVSGSYIPSGTENEDFIILSDQNRSEISVTTQRLENRQRMVNGTMRSYHTADKLNISVGWTRLPSRTYNNKPTYDSFGKITSDSNTYIFDGGAGGNDLLTWYESHQGPFYVFLSYDKFRTNSDGTIENISDWPTDYQNFTKYKQVVHMYFSSFDYTIEKRGSNNHDFWNINLSLEEV
jgi:hypothetical protein